MSESGKCWALIVTETDYAVAIIVVLLLASIIFFTAIVFGMALMLRNRWDDMNKMPPRQGH